jgi:ribosomal protein S18 acetylase RimI-like enzyme
MPVYAELIGAHEAARATATLTLAFANDPMVRWSWPAPEVFLASFPLFVEALAGAAFTQGSAYQVDGMRGVALWMPPGVTPDDAALDLLFERTTTLAQQQYGAAVFEQMAKHRPRERHWHLPLIGVDPLAQGKALGAALMAPALARCDADGVLAYLESSNPRNIPFYERLGFRRSGEIQVGDSPRLTPMTRSPR